ncbi:Gfo/Idh/MocA family oxidoreductase [Peribacillus sp. SI8-4]|uniref:Gfo/Idh/MocA family protein n=1 Tax=Peribacillus sp. SI8-4 TaxID=3048009 RepID=UPI0025576A4C|nr:Gfo/Idh/MocA family oxidoreductase [Peribacillus sp. SI8-4]
MLKTAVIGLGDISPIHILAIQANPLVELCAVCDIDDALKDSVPGVKFYEDYQEMIELEAVDCVHLCLPHHLHYPVAKYCIEQGVHVFLEKPLGLNIEEGLALVKLEEGNKHVRLCVCLQNRFNESFEKLLIEVESGKYGKVLGVKGIVAWSRPPSYYEMKPWRGKMAHSGGGVMINQALHTLDLMQLIGGEVVSIKGEVSRLLDYEIEVEDTAAAHITFENGARGLFFATIANADNDSVELQVMLEKGKLTIKDSILFSIDEEGKMERLAEDAKLPGSKFYYGASHAKLIDAFYHSILFDTQAYVHAREAIQSLKMIEAIRKSSQMKKAIFMEGQYNGKS